MVISFLFRLFRRKRNKYTPLIINYIDEDYIIELCYRWNLSYPIDRWWREKHKVAFGSPEHRAVSFLDMKVEFEEESLYAKGLAVSTYKPNTGDFIIEREIVNEDAYLTEEERLAKYQKEFAEMDLSQYND